MLPENFFSTVFKVLRQVVRGDDYDVHLGHGAKRMVVRLTNSHLCWLSVFFSHEIVVRNHRVDYFDRIGVRY